MLKIPCGGFYLDSNTLAIDEVSGKPRLKVIGGTATSVDNKSLVNIGGIISLKGLLEASVGQSPRKAADGSLEWYTPDATEVQSLKNIVDSMSAKLGTIEEGAQVNVIESVKVDNMSIPVENKSINLPLANNSNAGLVRGSNVENSISASDDGVMFVNALNISKLSQSSEDELILNAGDSNIK